MIFLFWVGLILIASITLALLSLRKELQKYEASETKEEISKGRVIFHSSHFKKD